MVLCSAVIDRYYSLFTLRKPHCLLESEVFLDWTDCSIAVSPCSLLVRQYLASLLVPVYGSSENASKRRESHELVRLNNACHYSGLFWYDMTPSVWISYHILPPVFGLQEEKPETAYHMSIMWASHIAGTELIWDKKLYPINQYYSRCLWPLVFADWVWRDQILALQSVIANTFWFCPIAVQTNFQRWNLINWNQSAKYGANRNTV